MHENISRFWEIEEAQNTTHLSAEELECEKHFQQHTKRDKSGRYIVALPFKNNKETLGDSRFQALKRLKSLFYKFGKNSNLQKRYSEVINEYLLLGHMTEVTDVNDRDGFYLPHHAVFKEDSLSTK